MELAQFTMSLPKNLWISMNMKTDELMSEMRKEYGIKQYQLGRLTLSQSADFCGVNIYEFVSLLSLSAIPIVDYSAGELESEFEYFSKKLK